MASGKHEKLKEVIQAEIRRLKEGEHAIETAASEAEEVVENHDVETKSSHEKHSAAEDGLDVLGAVSKERDAFRLLDELLKQLDVTQNQVNEIIDIALAVPPKVATIGPPAHFGVNGILPTATLLSGVVPAQASLPLLPLSPLPPQPPPPPPLPPLPTPPALPPPGAAGHARDIFNNVVRGFSRTFRFENQENARFLADYNKAVLARHANVTSALNTSDDAIPPPPVDGRDAKVITFLASAYNRTVNKRG